MSKRLGRMLCSDGLQSRDQFLLLCRAIVHFESPSLQLKLTAALLIAHYDILGSDDALLSSCIGSEFANC
jgi:hypothetical protein